MIQSEINIKSGASFKSIVQENCFDSVDDAYTSFAACAVFQAFKDYKNWIVARHFALKDLDRVTYNYRLSSLLTKLCISSDAYRHRHRKREREEAIMRRVKRILEGDTLEEQGVFKEKALEEIKKGRFKEMRVAIKSLRYSTVKIYHSTLDTIKGISQPYAHVEHFFESPEFALFAPGIDGEQIKREAIRRAQEKIRRKELGLPDDEEDDDEE